ncbi:MAG: alpha/beta hydrolase [Acidimicrobiales bacterium]|nr:alpha/beta hydrolase [Acidimicrobiales bacterium]
MSCYDEGALLRENAEEAGLAWTGPPPLRRHDVEVGDGRVVSALSWQEGEPELVLVHGRGQNAHTWDTVALVLDRPLLAVDLPGHGHSSWRADADYRPGSMADDVTTVVRRLAPGASAMVGMSLGGLTAIAATDRHPDLVRRLALVDITPGFGRGGASSVASFLAGPESYASFDELLERTVAFSPTRSVSSLRRGLYHNARQREDGRWVWRHHVGQASGRTPPAGDPEAERARLWDGLSRFAGPLLLVRGANSPVVGQAEAEELARRRPDARVVVVPDAGHSIQGDQPVALAGHLTRFLEGGSARGSGG